VTVPWQLHLLGGCELKTWGGVLRRHPWRGSDALLSQHSHVPSSVLFVLAPGRSSSGVLLPLPRSQLHAWLLLTLHTWLSSSLFALPVHLHPNDAGIFVKFRSNNATLSLGVDFCCPSSSLSLALTPTHSLSQSFLLYSPIF
jgi:hypothetical protein